MDDWKLLVLEHDLASREIADFFKKIWKDGIIVKEIDAYSTGIKKEGIAEKVGKGIGDLKGKILTLYGQGGLHHYTYGLCNHIAKKRSKDYMYIHVDHHQDTYYSKYGYIGCSAFVMDILEAPGAKEILSLGSVNYDISDKRYISIGQDLLMSQNSKEILEKVLGGEPQEDAYPSLDLDVLADTEISTYYSRGILKQESSLRSLNLSV